MKKRLPKSLRKYIRKEKARIRQQVFGFKKQKELIDSFYKEIFDKYKGRQEKNKHKH